MKPPCKISLSENAGKAAGIGHGFWFDWAGKRVPARTGHWGIGMKVVSATRERRASDEVKMLTQAWFLVCHLLVSHLLASSLLSHFHMCQISVCNGSLPLSAVFSTGDTCTVLPLSVSSQNYSPDLRCGNSPLTPASLWVLSYTSSLTVPDTKV